MIARVPVLQRRANCTRIASRTGIEAQMAYLCFAPKLSSGNCAQSVPIETSRCAPNCANTLPLFERFRAGLGYGKQMILKEI